MTPLTQIGFSEAEIKCLLFISRAKKASLKRVSREADITENLAKIMLHKLKKRSLVCIQNNNYIFCGVTYLLNYLEAEKKNSQITYQEAIEEMKGFFSVE